MLDLCATHRCTEGRRRGTRRMAGDLGVRTRPDAAPERGGMSTTKVQAVALGQRVSRGEARRAARGTIEVVVRATGIPAHVVRYYARIGLVKPRRDPRNGYKLFTDAQCRRLLFIRCAQRLGYTLCDIQEILQDADRGRSPCLRAREIIQRRIDESRQELTELSRVQRQMEQALRRWGRMPGKAPTGDAVCHLVESGVLGQDRQLPRIGFRTRPDS